MNIKYKYVKTKIINNIETKIYFATGSKKEYVYYKKKYIPIGDYKKIKLVKGGGSETERANFLKQVKLFDKIIEDKLITTEELNVSPIVSATLGYRGIGSQKVPVKETTGKTSPEILEELLLDKKQHLQIATAQKTKNSSLISRVSAYRTVNSENRDTRIQLMTDYNVIYKEFILPYLEINKFITLLKNFRSSSNIQYAQAIKKLKLLKSQFGSIDKINDLLNKLQKEIENELENIKIGSNTQTNYNANYNDFLSFIVRIIKENKDLRVNPAKILKNIKESISTVKVINKDLKQTLNHLLPSFITPFNNDIDNLLKIVNIAVKCDINLKLSLDYNLLKETLKRLSYVDIEKFKDIKSLISMCSSKKELFKLFNARIKNIIIMETIEHLRNDQIIKLLDYYKLLIETKTDNDITTDDCQTITNKIKKLYLDNILYIEPKPDLLEIIKEYNSKYNSKLYDNINEQINQKITNKKFDLDLFKLILLLRHFRDDAVNQYLIRLISYIITNIKDNALVDSIYSYNSIKINLEPEIQEAITNLIITKIEEEKTTDQIINQIINKNINTLLLLLYVFNPVEVGNQITLIITNSEIKEDAEALHYKVTILKSENKFYSNTIIDIFEQDLINIIKILNYNKYKKDICDTTENESIQDKCTKNQIENIQDKSKQKIDIADVMTILKNPESVKFKSSKPESSKPESPKSRSSKSGSSKPELSEYNNTIIENLILLLCNSITGIKQDTIDISKIPEDIPTNSLDEECKAKLEQITYLQCATLDLKAILTKLQLTDLLIDESFDIKGNGIPFITGIKGQTITHTYRKDTINALKKDRSGNIKHPNLNKKMVLNEVNTTLLEIINLISEKVSTTSLQPIIYNINKLKEETERRLEYYGSFYDDTTLYDNLKKLSSFITMFDVSPYLDSSNRVSHSNRVSPSNRASPSNRTSHSNRVSHSNHLRT